MSAEADKLLIIRQLSSRDTHLVPIVDTMNLLGQAVIRLQDRVTALEAKAEADAKPEGAL